MMKTLWLLLAMLLLTNTPALSSTVMGLLKGKREILVTARSQGEVVGIHFQEGDQIKTENIVISLDHKKETIERDLAKTEFQTAKSDYEKSKQLKKYLSADEIIKKKDNFLRKRSIFELKEYNLSTKRVKSPISGMVTKIFIKKGENIKSGDKAFEVIQMDNLVINLDIEAAKATELKLGSFLYFSSELHPGQEFQAKIFFIGPVLDKSSGTINVKLELENKKNPKTGHFFRPGTLVKVELK